MGTKNRVIWSDGLFIKPQHLQQQQRHTDYIINNRLGATQPYFYGLSRLEIDPELLKLGKIGLNYAVGTMPDGTYFDIPFQDCTPKPLEINANNAGAGQIIYLALPINSDVISEVDTAQESATDMTRYKNHMTTVRDLHTKGGQISTVHLAQLSPRIMSGTEDLSAYTALPLCRVKEVMSDNTVILDETYIPTVTSVNVSSYLNKFLDEVSGIIAERAKQLSSRIGSPSQQGIADVAEFLMLQLLNRQQPCFMHLAKRKSLHPETLYFQLAQLCSELMTFTSESRLSAVFAPYDHDDLSATFYDLSLKARLALSVVLTPKAVSISLDLISQGLYSGVVHDQQLLDQAEFILAVKSSMPQEQLHKYFVQQTKITSPDKIRELVTVQISGVKIGVMSAAPRQLPYHAGYTYFALDTNSAEWKDIQKSKSLSIHISGSFPDLDIQLWAVRG